MKEHYLGRSRELKFLLNSVLSGGSGRVINLFGCAGVGKSRLLLRFEEELAARQVPVIRLDPAEVETAVRNEAVLAPHLAQEIERGGAAGSPTVVVIDDYRPLPGVGAVARSRLLPQVSASAPTVMATRQPLSDWWCGDPAALDRLDSLQLLPFSPKECREYLLARGIRDLALHDQIVAFAGGLPLALSLAVDSVEEGRMKSEASVGGQGEFQPVSFHEAAHRIVRRVAEEVPGEELWSLLEAACVVRSANEEVLSYLVGRTVRASLLSQLCMVSAVRLTEEGLVVHPGIRQAVIEDLRWRAPKRYAELREKAASWAAGDGPERVEMLRLAGDPYLQSYLLADGGERTLTCSGPPPEPAEVIQAHQGWLTTYLSQPEDRRGEAEHLLALLAEYPEGFVTVRDGKSQKLLGFTCTIPVEPELLPVLNRSDEVRSYLEQVSDPLRPSRLLLYPAYLVDGQDYAARGALIKACLERCSVLRPRKVIVTWVHDPMAARRAEKMLFTRVPGLTYLGYGPGLPVTYYELDLVECGPREWVERIAATLRGEKTVPQSAASLREAIGPALRGYWQDGLLEESALARLSSVRTRARALTGEGVSSGVANALRATLDEALDELAQSRRPHFFRHGAEEARVLRLAYVDRVGSHERAMERLGLARTTYYRRLQAGLDHLATILAAREPLDKRSAGRAANG